MREVSGDPMPHDVCKLQDTHLPYRACACIASLVLTLGLETLFQGRNAFKHSCTRTFASDKAQQKLSSFATSKSGLTTVIYPYIEHFSHAAAFVRLARIRFLTVKK
jgi:hypothetical protein